jgi:hypothetical protein
MNYRVVLEVDAFADDHRSHVTADDRPKPDAAVRADGNVADDRAVLRSKKTGINTEETGHV